MTVEVRPWRDVQVGDVIEVHDREMLPADVVILATAEADGACRVDEYDLDRMHVLSPATQSAWYEPATAAQPMTHCSATPI